MRKGDIQDQLIVDELKFLMHSYINSHIESTDNLNDESDY
jgi:hypothetical protein